MKLLCFAHGTDGDWEAICLDLDIAVQGNSFDEVKHALESAIESYARDVAAEDEATARRLSQRRAPWYVRLSYVTKFLLATLLRRDDEYRYAFNIPCMA